MAEGVLAAPAGVALIQALELEHRNDAGWFDSPSDSDPAAVLAAVRGLAQMEFGVLLQHLVSAAERFAGPWVSDAPAHLSHAYRLAPERRAIAAAISDRFGDALGAACQLEAQEWWTSATDPAAAGPCFVEHSSVYCCGEFSWDGLWTVSTPPVEVHDGVVDAWELFPGPISRWWLPIETAARVFEVSSAEDWARLVARYPLMTTRSHGGWELPGPNQHVGEARELEIASAGAAARHQVRVAMPDWPSVAVDYDGVHLSWRGMLLAEGHVISLPALGPDVVTALRYWSTERTLWLRDVFGPPTPLSAPVLSGGVNTVVGVDATVDSSRRHADAKKLIAMLGCDPFTRHP